MKGLRHYPCRNEIQAIITGIWNKIAPKCWHQVERCTTKSPLQPRVMSDRVVTPRYAIDFEAPEFTELSLALMIVYMPFDILDELKTKIAQTVQYLSSRDDFDVRNMVGFMEYVPPQVDVRKEAYMLDMFTWVTANGFIVDKAANPEFTASLPIATLPLNVYTKTGLLHSNSGQ